MYRPQPVYWRGNKDGKTPPSPGRYNDSQLTSQMWVDRHRDVSVSESEGDDVTSASNASLRRVPRPGAFQPVQPAHVTQAPPPKREKRSRRRNRDAQPEMKAGAEEFPPTANQFNIYFLQLFKFCKTVYLHNILKVISITSANAETKFLQQTNTPKQ